MPLYQLLTDRTLAQSSAITPTTLIHIVYTGDPSQNIAGSSYKAELGQLAGLFSGGSVSGDYLPLSGGTVSGATNFTNGLTASTVSATTYQNLPVSGLTGGSNINVSGSSGNYTISVTGITGGSTFTGGTVSGPTIFTSGLTATTVSATTYQNLPVSGITAGNNINVSGSSGNFIISFTGVTGGSTFTGGTVSGATNFTSGLTANTISATTYQNLPVSGLTEGSNINVSGSSGNYIISVTGITGGSTFTGGTVSGATNFTNGITANTISATTYQNLPVSGLTEGNNINISGSSGNFTISFTGVTGGSTFTGGTVSGATNFTNGLTANTISATTYQNLPVSGITAGSNINVSGSNGNYTISVTGITQGLTGDYLPLSGGTVTGGTVFTSGVTANTISQTSYIDFTTGSTNPSAFAGRLFFDSGEKALTYYNVINNPVPIAMGQQLYTRVWNNTGVQIDKGKVIMITGTSNNLPSAVLATNNHSLGSPRPIGVAAENIPSGSEGLVINDGILSGITINTFSNGDTLYLSDTVPGGYVSSTSSLFFSARTNEIGYVIQTGTTTGKIYVNINNEDSNLTLTDIERNILEGNVISTGAYEYTGMTINSSTTVNVSPMRGWIVQNTYSFATLPDVTNLYYTGGTGITITNIATADATYVLVNSASTLYQQTTYPTPQQRRENIFLGKVVHPNRTSLLTVNNTVDYDVSPMSALRDLWSPIKLINQGVLPSFNTGLTFNTSLGSLYGNGIGWTTNQLNPNSVTISAKTSASFFYRTQTGGTSGLVSVIDPTKYDVNGVITSVGAVGSNDATNQRIYLYPTGVINVLYGQTIYTTLTEAIANIDSETFVTYPNAETTAILIGVISVRNDIVADGEPLTNTNYAKLTLVSKFGESFGGTGGLSTTTLQQAYNNSSTPEITTNLTLGPLSVKNGAGTADNVTNVFEGVNSGGTTTSYVRADGAIYGSTISGVTISATTYQNLPVSGLTAGNNINVSDSSGNFTISVTGITGNYLPISGGTVSGATNFTNGLTANTISGGTYIGDGSQLNVANPSTGTTITFTAGTIYNTPTSAATGNISADTTNAKIGIVQKIYHNDSVAPTFDPFGWVKLGIGTYTISTLNVIYAEWVSGNRVEYWIVNGS